MQDIKQIQQENEELKKEVLRLSQKLEIVSTWMKREVTQQTHKVARQKTKKLTSEIKEDFLKKILKKWLAQELIIIFEICFC